MVIYLFQHTGLLAFKPKLITIKTPDQYFLSLQKNYDFGLFYRNIFYFDFLTLNLSMAHHLAVDDWFCEEDILVLYKTKTNLPGELWWRNGPLFCTLKVRDSPLLSNVILVNSLQLGLQNKHF